VSCFLMIWLHLAPIEQFLPSSLTRAGFSLLTARQHASFCCLLPFVGLEGAAAVSVATKRDHSPRISARNGLTTPMGNSNLNCQRSSESVFF
jgi:hypothetical protein